MTNEELKKKITDVLRDNRRYELIYYPYDNDTEVVIDYEGIADALISAGLVADVQSLADGNCVLYVKGKGFMRLYNEQDINKMIHRAEVAERELVKYKMAFDKAIKLAYKLRTDLDVLSCSSCEFGYAFDVCKKIGLYDDCENRWKEELLQQAEREIKERSND